MNFENQFIFLLNIFLCFSPTRYCTSNPKTRSETFVLAILLLIFRQMEAMHKAMEDGRGEHANGGEQDDT